MKKIKTAGDLPDFIKNKEYRKNLDAVDWYREIRRRSWMLGFVNAAANNKNYLGSNLAKKHSTLFFEQKLAKDHPFYILPRESPPVQDITKIQAMFIAESIDDSNSKDIAEKLSQLNNLYRNKFRNKNKDFSSSLYISAAHDFFEELKTNSEVNSPAYLAVESYGNPLLFYGRLVDGYPVIINPLWDDETIIKNLTQWLKNRREENDEKANRPFSQNDFDDWTTYRLRQVCDLNIWSRLNQVKISKTLIAKLLWPDSDCDTCSPIDILRTTSKKRAEALFQPEVAVRLYNQLLSCRGENFLSQ